MAKKMSTGKVVALALCVIVGAGSIAAFARGRDKDEEKEPAHVHSYTESNVCSCGERQETILFSDVKVGMDLSGYMVELAVEEGEMKEILGDSPLMCEAIDFFKGYRYHMTTTIGVVELHYLTHTVEDVTPPGYPMMLMDLCDGVDNKEVVLPEDFIVTETGEYRQEFDAFKLSYVGDSGASAVSFVLPSRETVREKSIVLNKEEFGSLENTIPSDSEEVEWTTLF